MTTDGKRQKGTLIGNPCGAAAEPPPADEDAPPETEDEASADAADVAVEEVEDGPDPDDPLQTSEHRSPPGPFPPPQPAATPATPESDNDPAAAASETNGLMRQAETAPPRPAGTNLVAHVANWFPRAERWAGRNRLPILCIMLFLGFWICAIAVLWHLGPPALKKARQTWHQADGHYLAKILNREPTASESETVQAAGADTSDSSFVYRCLNYEATKDASNVTTAGPCECVGDNCPKKIICNDDYTVELIRETVTNPDDTETSRIVRVEVDVSKCRKIY